MGNIVQQVSWLEITLGISADKELRTVNLMHNLLFESIEDLEGR